MSQQLRNTFADLERDLVHEDGPRISTMRNYRFCIVVYDPKREFELRREVQRLHSTLRESGWVVKDISLQKLLFARLRRRGEGFIQHLIDREKLVFGRNPARGINLLGQKLTVELEGPAGIARDVADEIKAFAKAHPDKVERTVAIVGRAGALYPFFRNSALLKHLDGQTDNIPVVLLYPGQREGDGLKFMGQLKPDSDYRPRIYG